MEKDFKTWLLNKNLFEDYVANVKHLLEINKALEIVDYQEWALNRFLKDLVDEEE